MPKKETITLEDLNRKMESFMDVTLSSLQDLHETIRIQNETLDGQKEIIDSLQQRVTELEENRK